MKNLCIYVWIVLDVRVYLDSIRFTFMLYLVLKCIQCTYMYARHAYNCAKFAKKNSNANDCWHATQSENLCQSCRKYSVQEQCSKNHGQNQPKIKQRFSTRTVWIFYQWNGCETNLWALDLGLTSGAHPTLRVSSHSILCVLQYVRLNSIIQKIGPSRSLSIMRWCDTHNRGREKSSGPSNMLAALSLKRLENES